MAFVLLALLAFNRVVARHVPETLTAEEQLIINQFDTDTLQFHELVEAGSVGAFLWQTTKKRKSSPRPGGKGGGKGKRIVETQLVFLDFEFLDPFYPVYVYDTAGTFCYIERRPRRTYSQTQRDAIKNRIEEDFKEFDFEFTVDRPHPLEGAFSTIRFYFEGIFDPFMFEPFRLNVPNCAAPAAAFVAASSTTVVSIPQRMSSLFV